MDADAAAMHELLQAQSWAGMALDSDMSEQDQEEAPRTAFAEATAGEGTGFGARCGGGRRGFGCRRGGIPFMQFSMSGHPPFGPMQAGWPFCGPAGFGACGPDRSCHPPPPGGRGGRGRHGGRHHHGGRHGGRHGPPPPPPFGPPGAPPFGPPPPPPHETPAVDILKEAEMYVLLADLPGFAKKDISVTVANGVLTLKGRLPRRSDDGESESPPEGILHERCPVDHFERSFRLVDDIDTAALSAKLVDGLLRVQLPMKAKPEPQSVPISSRTSSDDEFVAVDEDKDNAAELN